MRKNNIIVISILLGLFLLAIALFWFVAPRWFDPNEYPYYGHMIGGWGMPFGMIAMGIFWIAVIYFVFNGFGHKEGCRVDHAIETLKTRLAKGEITIEEYETLIKKLKE